LVTSLSWRWIFYINIPVCLAALALSVRSMPSARAPGRSPLDWVGLVLLGAAQVASGLGTGAILVPIVAAAFRGLEKTAVPRASTSIRIMQQLGASFGSAALFIVIAHQLTAHAHTAAGLAAAFSATFWRVLAFSGVMLIPVLFLPGRSRRAAGSGADPADRYRGHLPDHVSSRGARRRR
jgi:MFS family permease